MSELAEPQRAADAGEESVPTDLDLLRRLAEGSKAALAALYDRYSRVVYAYTAARLEPREDVEEISQDVFVTLWRKRATITIAGESALPWLLVTSRNLIANRRRSLQVVEKRRSDSPADVSLADVRPGPEELAERGQLLAYVDSVVAALTEPDRAVFELCIRGDHSYEEAARQVGLSEGAVRNRLSRLRGRLRNELRTLRGMP
ncbi:RNA polymerase sigma factor [Leifsonia sp. 21MFCrub1.1]|uniref:RNA polymerase sigma factor n=1 Tax=Leifsonia sp. 21MFCrub1.1 TaxID=1798223 RepID=UPI000892A0EE|nr:sigma-70 family RNA polymerase sigma factor [Leifsonia sp. 21MFCrub1.1]SEB13684.1 RNA polymerase sigma-70 factor, ECF subfamily [Leifsonia sp. 21MFCrub1.1]